MGDSGIVQPGEERALGCSKGIFRTCQDLPGKMRQNLHEHKVIGHGGKGSNGKRGLD